MSIWYHTVITLHADVVGSLLRPSELLKAQEQLAAGTISAVQFKEIEDQAVDGAIALQEEADLPVVTGCETSPAMLPGSLSRPGEFVLALTSI